MASASTPIDDDLLLRGAIEDCTGKTFPSFQAFRAWFDGYKVNHFWNCLVKKSQDDYFQAYCPTVPKIRTKGSWNYSFLWAAI